MSHNYTGPAEFTGLGPAPTKDQHWGVGDTVQAGAWGMLGAAAWQWLDSKRKPLAPPVTQEIDQPSTNDAAAEIMFDCWNTLFELRDYLATAPPVEEWDGDLRMNIRVCQSLEKYFPKEFEAWRKRNYGRSRMNKEA